MAFDDRVRQEVVVRLERNEDPAAVFMAYADNAPGWSVEISNQFKIDFSRTASGPRLPSHAPDTWEARQLATFSFLMDAGLDPDLFEVSEIVNEGDETVFRWIRPLRMTDTCLTCHGEDIAPSVRRLLGQEYPLDEAAGYAEGQIGGAYSVRKVLRVGDRPAPAWPTPDPPELPSADPSTRERAPPVSPR
jgi:hypothetical protein